MHFILISKKENFKDEQIDKDLLETKYAPSLISREAIKFEISNFIVYIYPYDDIDREIYGYSYYQDENRLLMCNGLFNVDDDPRAHDIKDLFNQITHQTSLIGDYQLISLDKDGNGFIKTPSISIRQLFFYEDENCAVISTEIKLIVDGINRFREKSFVEHFDLDFIKDSVFTEWLNRKVPENTVFKEIKRIFPHDTKYFKEGKIIVEGKKSIEVPEWFKTAFNEDREKLYDDYYTSLLSFAEVNLVNLKPHIKRVLLGLTGGVDSRLSLAILSKLCKKHEIPFECFTGGQDTHPDVVIAKKVAEALDIKHIHSPPVDDVRPNTEDYHDYKYTFYMAQGDWNSKNFSPSYNRKISTQSTLRQLGNSGYKKRDIRIVFRTNRWYARRILYNKNFFFPLFNTEYEMWFGLSYGELGEDAYKEFIYEILKRSEPKLLEIPFVGISLPQVNVEPYLKVNDSKHHEKKPFLWDYNFVRMNLKPLFKKKFDKELDMKSKIIFKLFGFNEFDYFFNKTLDSIEGQHRTNQIDMKTYFQNMMNEKRSPRYPKNKNMIYMTKENRLGTYTSKLQILMDFASVADKKSFREIEEDLALN